MSNWSFMLDVTDTFAETSVDLLEGILPNSSVGSSVRAVVLSEEQGRCSIIHQSFFCLSDVLGGYFIPVKAGKGDSLGPLA